MAKVDEDAAGAFDQDMVGVLAEDQVALGLEVGEGDALEAGGGLGGEGVAEADAFDGGDAGEAGDLLGVAGLVVLDAGLGGLHDDDALALGGQLARQRGGGDGLADASVGAGDESDPHGTRRTKHVDRVLQVGLRDPGVRRQPEPRDAVRGRGRAEAADPDALIGGR